MCTGKTRGRPKIQISQTCKTNSFPQISKSCQSENKYISFQIKLLLFTRDQIRENSFFQMDLRQGFSVTMIGPFSQIIENWFNEILVLFVRLYSKNLALLEIILFKSYEVNFLQARTNTIREKNSLTNVKAFGVYVRLSLFIMTIGPHCQIIENKSKLLKRNQKKCLAPLLNFWDETANKPDQIRENNLLTNVKTFWIYVTLFLFIMTIGPYCQIIEKKSKEVVGVCVQLIEKNFKLISCAFVQLIWQTCFQH